MEFIFFVVVIVFIALWLCKKPAVKSDDGTIDYHSNTYAQGYWDGYRACQNETNTNSNSAVQITDKLKATSTKDQQSVFDNDIFKPSTLSQSEQKAKHDLQNINTTLYIASFLLVAATTLFIGTALPESVRFVGVWVITILFYVVGMVLYKNVDNLRPAAVAFVGTGLAILPFTGVAMYNFIIQDASLCWLITSLIGLVVFVITAIRLQNQVISYFSIAFGVSLATSSVAILHAGLIWYFVASIVFGSLMTILAQIQPKLSWIPASFDRPIQESNNWIVPLTLVASLFAINGLIVRDYWILSLVSTFYYCAVATSSTTGREMASFVARFFASVTTLLMTYDFIDSWTAVGVAMSVVGILQILVSVVFLPKHTKGDENNETWLWLGLIMQLFALLFVKGSASWAIIMTGQLSGLLLISLGVSYYLRRATISIFGVISLAILPILICKEVIKPAIELNYASLIFIIFSTILIIIRFMVNSIKPRSSWHWLLVLSFCLFIIESILLASGDWWSFSIWSCATILLYFAIYIERQPWLVIVANVALLMSGGWFLDALGITDEWVPIYLSWIVFIAFYGMYRVMLALSKKQYGIYFWWSSVIATGLLNLMSLDNSSIPIVTLAGLGITLVSIILITKGWLHRQYAYIDIGVVLATIGLQRLISVNITDIDPLVYTHWWAIAIAGLSYLYYKADKIPSAKLRIVIALLIVTSFSGMAAISTESGNVLGLSYRSIFLIEHVFILVSGLVLSKKLFTIWGAVGAVLAVLWMLKGYTYLLLVSIAFLLIGIAIYALTKQSNNIDQK